MTQEEQDQAVHYERCKRKLRDLCDVQPVAAIDDADPRLPPHPKALTFAEDKLRPLVPNLPVGAYLEVSYNPGQFDPRGKRGIYTLSLRQRMRGDLTAACTVRLSEAELADTILPLTQNAIRQLFHEIAKGMVRA